MISLKQLKYFDAVARCGHFGKAAEQCAVSQPALSMQIQELEKFLEVSLFERGRGPVMLTNSGKSIALRAARILADARDIVDLARLEGKSLSGRLGLGVIPSIAPYILPRLLPSIRDTYPELEFRLRETQTQFLLESTSSTAGFDTLTINGNGPATAPLSAGGVLVLNAVNIAQDGTLWAPLGNIVIGVNSATPVPAGLSGLFGSITTTNVALGAGSLTSVSAAGLDIPYGYTTNGTTWYLGPSTKSGAATSIRSGLRGIRSRLALI